MKVEKNMNELKIKSDLDHFKLLTIYIGKHKNYFG